MRSVLRPLLLLVGAALVLFGGFGIRTAAGQGKPPPVAYLPLLFIDYTPPRQPACRLGIGAGQDLGTYPVNDLGAGWYVDWGAAAHPNRPGGMEYMPTIRLRQTGPASYALVSPPASALAATVLARPGTTWLIGNEPDRRKWQDDIEPQVYARAYHDLYYQIKALAPDAQIIAGNIVQPTPLRLQYLDMVLDDYRAAYGEAMPVDGWAIHTYPLHERSCSVYPEDCWGAEIPPGINAGEGVLYGTTDSGNPDIFKGFVTTFRQWMADRGYRDRPLLIPEWGVLMPKWFVPEEQVNAYMDATTQWLVAATDPNTGYPADNNHLVQRAAWYSLTDTTFNGWLYESSQAGGATVITRTSYGDNFIKNSASIPATINFTPVGLAGHATSSLKVTLTARVANNGNILSPQFSVRFYDGPPGQGGTVIGDAIAASGADGCATPVAALSLDWSGGTPGKHIVFAVVDPGQTVKETNESDNLVSGEVLVPDHVLYLPVTGRPGAHP